MSDASRERMRAAYRSYSDDDGRHRRWSLENPGNHAMVAEKVARVDDALRSLRRTREEYLRDPNRPAGPSRHDQARSPSDLATASLAQKRAARCCAGRARLSA